MASTNFTYSPTTGNGNTYVQVSALAVNAGYSDLSATLTFSNGVGAKSVSITQKFCPYFSQFGSFTFPDTGGSIYFTVYTEYDIVFRSVPSWITIRKNGVTYSEGERISSGTANGTYELIAAANSGDTRSVGSTMNMGHYIGNVLQNRVQYFNFSQKASNRILPLTMEILTGGTINFKHNRTLVSDVGNLSIQYQVNAGTWTTLTSSTGGTSIQVNTGDVVKFKGDNATYSTLPLSYTTFSGSTAIFNLKGNIMSLVNSTGFSGMSVVSQEYEFNRMFANTNVVSAEELVLPATAIAQHAYTSMFQDCTSLTTAPELPAPTLTVNCYDEMFNGCSSLNHIRCYATDISALNCTYNWVSNVATAGTFVKHTDMTGWTVGNNGIPTNWVVQNYTPVPIVKSLTIQPSSVDVSSAATSTTVSIVAENCIYSSMTVVSGGSFPITVANVQNGVVTLTFSSNSGVQRVGTLAFTLYDTENGTYSSTVTVSQAGASFTPVRWTLHNDSKYGIYGTLIKNDSGTGPSVQLPEYAYNQYYDTGAFTITEVELTIQPELSFPERYYVLVQNGDTLEEIMAEYDSKTSSWKGSGAIPVGNADNIYLTVGIR